MFGILCLVFLPIGFASIDTTCLPPNEVVALREIGSKLGKSWDFKEDPCSGKGDWVSVKSNDTNDPFENIVKCASNGIICNIVSISLKGQNLNGTLPSELVKLRYLQNLYITFFVFLLFISELQQFYWGVASIICKSDLNEGVKIIYVPEVEPFCFDF
ncbi:hypothetical protein OSB04_005860 [Centaurea solstitialis]|uniref:Uncharacterized protein n=1 Tax=Centaurea solstitialis TaxID=347529 RepID=A0AA38TGV0_9ASTR|nr:hypothetical protein OSB04_005860 [Centaurea solstitialis]